MFQQDSYSMSKAYSEGWKIGLDPETGMPGISRTVDPHDLGKGGLREPAFKSDAEALGYVEGQAAAGSKLHHEALYLIGRIG